MLPSPTPQLLLGHRHDVAVRIHHERRWIPHLVVDAREHGGLAHFRWRQVCPRDHRVERVYDVTKRGVLFVAALDVVHGTSDGHAFTSAALPMRRAQGRQMISMSLFILMT
jgi:hypothetical protein